MKLATIAWGGATSAALVLDDAHLAPVRALPGRDGARDVSALIAAPLTAEEVERLGQLGEPLADATLAPPVLHPPKNVLCVGKNFDEHVKEGARAEGIEAVTPPAPIWFSKAHTTLLGCGGTTVLDPAFSTELDYEGELALVIGRGGRNIEPADALDHAFGYTIANDLTARDRQRLHDQWFKGKSADGYLPLGPWVVTADEIPDPGELRVRTTVDGDVRQDGHVRDMIFDLPTLIADISQGMTLEPGDVIATGTPSGVAWGTGQDRYLRDGQVVAVEVERIGRLWSRIAHS